MPQLHLINDEFIPEYTGYVSGFIGYNGVVMTPEEKILIVTKKITKNYIYVTLYQKGPYELVFNKETMLLVKNRTLYETNQITNPVKLVLF